MLTEVSGELCCVVLSAEFPALSLCTPESADELSEPLCSALAEVLSAALTLSDVLGTTLDV